MTGVGASLRAFLGAGVRPPTPLARKIVAALVFKVCALALLWFVFFSPAQQTVVTDFGVERVMLGTGAPARKGGAFHE